MPLRFIRMREEDLAAVREHAREGGQWEVCGILVGTRERDSIRVTRVVRARNAHTNPRTEYLIDPDELRRLMLQAEDEWGEEVLGFYHSHPRGPPHLSQRDRARASWPDAAYLLAWTDESGEGIGCWQWDAARGEFAPLELVPPAANVTSATYRSPS